MYRAFVGGDTRGTQFYYVTTDCTFKYSMSVGYNKNPVSEKFEVCMSAREASVTVNNL